MKVRKCHLRYLRCCGRYFPGPGSGVPGDFPELRGESKSFIKKDRLYIHVRSHGYRSGNAAFGGVGTAICLCDLPWQHGRQKRSGKRYEGNGLFLLAAAYITDSYGWGYSQRHVLLLPLWIGLLFFQKRSADIYASVSAYGIFVGRYLITILMPVAILTAGILPGVARTGSHIRKKKKDMPELHFRQEYRGRWYTDSFSRHGSRYWQHHCHRLWINLRKWHLPVCSLRDLR